MEDPEADTEWNDILRARGILPPKSGPTEEEIFEELDKEIRDKHDKHLEDKSLEELDELEDEEDERILMEYRKKRIAEMKAEAIRGKFGQVIQISKTDFVKDVTETNQCIPNYPDKNLPTLLIYHNGDLAQQLVGLSTLGGINMKLEAYLSSVDAIEEVLK
nr:12602_t:CDS:2 [Entrophospora candida]